MGIGEEVKGKAKQVVGDLSDNPDLREEGRAQQDKGAAERKADQERAKAKAHEVEAKEKEMEQQSSASRK
jgi:uncharacterized protein YjbJ (UPF0337 family)